MKKLLLLTLTGLTLLSGCVTLDNRVACTVAKDEAFVVSQYGRVGISSTIAKADTAVICK